MTLPTTHGPIQPGISNLARKDNSRTSFNELMDNPFDFLEFVMNRLKVDTLTPELLVVYKAPTDQLDWNNPEGQQYPHDLRKPLPLIPTSWGRRVIPFDHFINNDLEYLRGGISIRMYTTSVKKTKAADYGHIKWIEDLVPRTMWSQVPVSYDKHALWRISHWGANINRSMDLRLTRNMLEMSTRNVESSLSQSFKSSNGIITSIWIGSLEVFFTRDSTVRLVKDIPVDLDGAIRNFYHHMSEVRADRIVRNETTQGQLKICDDHDNLRRRWRRLESFAERQMINQRVAEALEAHEINRNLGHENLNGNDIDKNGNGNGNGNGEWKCVAHQQLFKKIPMKYATCTLLDNALTWWNSYKITIRTDAAYALSLRELMKLMTKVYCREMRFKTWKPNCGIFWRKTMTWPLTLKEPTRLQDAIRIANNLMDKKLKGCAVKNTETKRRFDTNHRDNRGQ
nr:hypothetical protein [Tanacetum cinerariifolium]